MKAARIGIALLLTPLLDGAGTPSPALLVLNKADNILAIINPFGGMIVARIPNRRCAA